ncbi:MAG: hypothetical protein KDI46_02475 [Alphaproteobacteria bacterium]|nr:hypothetical protein [Alphaproteobacteria bacterium]
MSKLTPLQKEILRQVADREPLKHGDRPSVNDLVRATQDAYMTAATHGANRTFCFGDFQPVTMSLSRHRIPSPDGLSHNFTNMVRAALLRADPHYIPRYVQEPPRRKLAFCGFHH